VTEVITMALPGVVSDTERRKLLEEAVLAYADGEESGEAAVTVITYVNESLSLAELDKLCMAYRNAVTARDALGADRGCWRDHYPELEGPGQEDVAPQIAADDVADTMNVLMFGSSAR
jgi:hypothetical protein